MRLIAIISMIFGWLLFSGSAFAGCPMCVPTQPAADAHHQAAMDMPGSEQSGKAKDPCAAGMSSMPFCVLCLVIPPVAPIDGGAKHLFAYPAPAAGTVLADLRLAPQAPPPRLV